MKVLFLTNMPAYHQLELADAFAELLGADNFCLGIYAPLSAERIQMNWQDSFHSSYLLRYSSSAEARASIHRWIRSADVVIHGRFPIRYLRKRIATGGLTYAYQERVWKKPFSMLRFIRKMPHFYKNYWSVNRKNYHLLAAGAYTSGDMARLGGFKNRSWKFGYFIQPRQVCLKPALAARFELVWCARMIALKQPHRALEFASGLRHHDIDFRLTMIGDGALFNEIKATIERQNLQPYVQMLGSKSIHEVNSCMAKSDIMLMTSNRREGWGLVINEAINNRCFVVANETAGASKWLIEHGKTGLIYREEQLSQTIENLAVLCQNKEALRNMAQLGYDRLTKNWSVQEAAGRVLKLSELILNGESAKQLFDNGPCSAD